MLHFNSDVKQQETIERTAVMTRTVPSMVGDFDYIDRALSRWLCYLGTCEGSRNELNAGVRARCNGLGLMMD